MTAIALTPFAGLVGDLLAAVSRLLDALTSPDELSVAAGRLAAFDRDVTAIVIGVRRDLESLLDEGVASKPFAVNWSPVAEGIQKHMLKLEVQRQQLLALPAQVKTIVLPDFDTLLNETRALNALFTEVLAVARSPLPAGFWERAEAGAKGPFFSEESGLGGVPVEHVRGIAANDGPPPDDETVRRWVEEHRAEKYAP